MQKMYFLFLSEEGMGLEQTKMQITCAKSRKNDMLHVGEKGHGSQQNFEKHILALKNTFQS